jgi:hypothetical protein
MNEDSKIAQDDLKELVDLVLRSTVTQAPASQEVELLTNGDFENEYTGWEVTNGGSGWAIKTSDNGDGINWCESSYALCTMSQTVTLADKGISAEKIDAGNVTCNASAEMRSASEDYNSTGKGGRVCDVTVQMLDANGTVLKTITVLNDLNYYGEWTPFSVTDQLAVGTRQLKYIVRGEDYLNWTGTFGPRFRNLSMKVK